MPTTFAPPVSLSAPAAPLFSRLWRYDLDFELRETIPESMKPFVKFDPDRPSRLADYKELTYKQTIVREFEFEDL